MTDTNMVGTLGFDAARIDMIHQDAVHVARELTVMESLVLDVNDDNRIDDLPRQYHDLPTLETNEIGEYDEIAVGQTMNVRAGNIITPSEKETSLFVSDRRQRANPRVNDWIAFEVGKAMALDREQALLGVLRSASDLPDIGTAGQQLNLTNIRTGAALLNANGHRGRDLYCVLHEWQYFPIAEDLDAISSPTNAPESLKQAVTNGWYVASLGKLHFFITSLVEVDQNDDAYGGIFVRDAIGIDRRWGPQTEPQRKATRRGTELVTTQFYGAGKWAPKSRVRLIGDVATADPS